MPAWTTARRDGLGLLRTEFNERNPEISPDGNWLAYESNASGQFEVYVRPFPDVDSGRWQVSTAAACSRQPLAVTSADAVSAVFMEATDYSPMR